MHKYYHLYIRITRTALLLLILTSSCGNPSQDESTKGKPQNPNIIYILADDLGYGDVQCFNPEGKIPTPNIDDMAGNGIRFTDVHTSSAVCTPTRYGILTGRYNWRTTLKSFVLSGYSTSLIKQGRKTVAGMLQQQGYTTAFVGKWHLGWDWDIITSENDGIDLNSLNVIPEVNYDTPVKNGPLSHGFDYSFGFSGSLDMPPYVYVENDVPTMSPTRTTVCVDEKGFWREGPTSGDFNHETVLQDLTDKAIALIEQNAKDDSPFFLYFPLPAPHTPILPTTEFIGKSNTNLYGDFVMQVDDVVGQVRKALKEQNISENTLLVFTSDNGCSPRANYEELARVGHNPSYVFRGTKADIFEGGHRVPFIVEWPEGALKNKVVDKTICTTDFFATCAELTNYKMDDTEGEDSYSLLPLIRGESDNEIREYIVHHSVNGSFAIRNGDWKLCFCPGSGGWSDPKPQTFRDEKLNLPAMQLYNLKDDIGETKNLLHEYPEIAGDLKKALAKIILDGRSTKGETQENEGMTNWHQIESIIDPRVKISQLIKYEN